MSNDRHDKAGRFASKDGDAGMKGGASVESHVRAQHRSPPTQLERAVQHNREVRQQRQQMQSVRPS